MKKFLEKLYWATVFSLRGLRAAWHFQWAFRLEVLAFICGIPLAIYFGHETWQKFILIFSLLWILVAELLNSAIETIVDRIGTDHHELSGRAKNLGSAAVFILVLNALLTWGIILLGNPPSL